MPTSAPTMAPGLNEHCAVDSRFQSGDLSPQFGDAGVEPLRQARLRTDPHRQRLRHGRTDHRPPALVAEGTPETIAAHHAARTGSRRASPAEVPPRLQRNARPPAGSSRPRLRGNVSRRWSTLPKAISTARRRSSMRRRSLRISALSAERSAENQATSTRVSPRSSADTMAPPSNRRASAGGELRIDKETQLRTRMRRPRMQGRPPHTVTSVVIRSILLDISSFRQQHAGWPRLPTRREGAPSLVPRPARRGAATGQPRWSTTASCHAEQHPLGHVRRVPVDLVCIGGRTANLEWYENDSP